MYSTSTTYVPFSRHHHLLATLDVHDVIIFITTTKAHAVTFVHDSRHCSKRLLHFCDVETHGLRLTILFELHARFAIVSHLLAIRRHETDIAITLRRHINILPVTN